MTNITITKDYVKYLFDYKCGELIWKNSKHPKRNGKFAGCLMEKTGYLLVGIEGKSYLVHQIIFLWHHGYIPKLIDHKDRNRINNWIENLRECDRVQNQENRTMAETGHKYKGVRKNKLTGNKWGAFIQKEIIGLFDDENEAAVAYNTEAKKRFGEFAYLNTI